MYYISSRTNRCIRTQTLLELARKQAAQLPSNLDLSESISHALFPLCTVKASLEVIISALEQLDKDTISNTASIATSVTPQPAANDNEKSAERITITEKKSGVGRGQQSSFLTTFDDVVGNSAAKQALYENVVLPLTLGEDIKARLFSGIRAGTGNVILYGPPGTGKRTNRI
jgi:ATP-dependent 26S proteasome regulatory subunit